MNKSDFEASKDRESMVTSCVRNFFDVTRNLNPLTAVHGKIEFKQLQRTGKPVNIDPSDTEAVVNYFRTTYLMPLNPLVAEKSQISVPVRLGYFYLYSDAKVSYRASVPPPAKYLNGCCIVLLSAYLSNLSETLPAATPDAPVKPRRRALPEGAQIIEDKVCWPRHLNVSDMPDTLWPGQFKRFHQSTDWSLFQEHSSVDRGNRASDMWQVIALLVDMVNAVPSMTDGVRVSDCSARCAHHEDPDYKLADCVLSYQGQHMILALLRKPDVPPDTTGSRSFLAEDIDKARAACTAFSKKEKRPVFCVLTDLTIRWVFFYNTIGRPGVPRYNAKTHGMIYLQELTLPPCFALPVVRGLLRYCITYVDPFYRGRNDWWSKDDRPNDENDDHGNQEASGKPDEDPGVQDRCRRRREFFKWFDII